MVKVWWKSKSGGVRMEKVFCSAEHVIAVEQVVDDIVKVPENNLHRK